MHFPINLKSIAQKSYCSDYTIQTLKSASEKFINVSELGGDFWGVTFGG